jgi:hypothetical protein
LEDRSSVPATSAAGAGASAGPVFDEGTSAELAGRSVRNAGAASRSDGAFIHTATASADTAAIGTSQRTVDACHHLRAGRGAAVFAIAASSA